MKKNRLQIISLTLNAVLLAVLVFQGVKLENLHAETMKRMDQMESQMESRSELLKERVDAIRTTQREQSEFLADYRFVPDTVNAETGVLDVAMELTLRRWTEDTTVDLLVKIGGESRTFHMTGVDGVFTAPVSLPLEGSGELFFEASITSQGVTVREDVTGYESLSMLLPLCHVGGGYGGPEYRGGVLEVKGYDVGIERKYGTDVRDPVLRVLKNGVTVQEVSATVSTTSGYSSPNKTAYAPDTENESLWVDCADGDTIEIHLICQDNFGLSYDFFVNGWSIEGNGATERSYPDGDCTVQVFS